MHRWRFFRTGGFDQVQLDSGADLLALEHLDKKLWVALACPVDGLELDTQTLRLIDSDQDGRIRPPELLGAIQWAGGLLKNPDDLLKSSATLPLASIADQVPEGARLLACARRILESLNKGNQTSISLEDCQDTVRIFAASRFNGDGVVPEDSADAPEVRALIRDILATTGGVPDRGGKIGADQAAVDRFFAEAAAWVEWQSRREPGSLEEQADAALTLVNQVREKVEDYFTRCRLASFDARSVNALGTAEADLSALYGKSLSLTVPEIAALPLAPIGPGKAIPFGDSCNPAWSGPMARLRTEVLEPLLGSRNALSEADWRTVVEKMASYADWKAGAVGEKVAPLGMERVQALLGEGPSALNALLQEDRKPAAELSAISEVERLVRYHRDLVTLVNNFVSFRSFYGRKEKAIFQAGTLYLDQRACELVMVVNDAGGHAALAGYSSMYLVYCDVTRRATGEKKTIVAAISDGDADNLMVGRNGVYYDRQGRDWDATVVKIVDQPISVRQAFWSPYKKAARLVEEQIEKFAASKEQASSDLTSAAAAGPAPATPFDVAKFAGIFAAIGLALGAIGGAAGMVLSAFLALPAWQMPLVVAGLLLVISGPSMLLAAMKLRNRNLGPLLDANGWAINTRARINVPFGRSLTSVATLPPGSQTSMEDPYHQGSPLGWWLLLGLALLVGWLLASGHLDAQGFHTAVPTPPTIPEVTP